jgi:uncharacterized protein (DUF885 family)
VRTILALLLLWCVNPGLAANATDARFKALYEREWAWRMAEFPLQATGAGVHDFDDRLGRVDEASQRKRLSYWRGVAAELGNIEASALSPTERINHAIYRDQIDSLIGGIEVRSYLLPVNSDSSFYADLAQLPRSHPLETLRDYENYVARLRAIPGYFDQHIELMRIGLKSGISVSRAVLVGRDNALSAHTTLRRAEDSPYYEPFLKLPAAIPEGEHARLRAAAVAAIDEAVTPAYARLLQFMRLAYIPHARRTLSAEKMPGGEAFYARQIKDFVTLELDPDAIHARGLAEVARIRAEMNTVMRDAKFEGTFAEFLEFLRTDPRFYAKDADELLMRAADIAKRVDAQLPRYFGLLPRLPFGIAPVPAAIAPYYTGGRYSPPAYGSREPGFYWVNTYKLESRPLYTLPALTLHEAVPGHHLQGALANEQGEQPPFRRFTYISAFGEGWALYAEHLGVEMGIYRTPYEHFGRLTYEMWRACRLVIDTGVHHLDWTREQARAYLHDNTALSEHEVVTEIDRYISWPGQALSYKWGELLIRDLRARAESELGPRFDIRAFHDAVLALGSVPLPVLEQQVEAFIAERKGPQVTEGNAVRR